MRFLTLGAAALLSACASGRSHDAVSDAALTAVQNARVRECPTGSTLANARTASDTQAVGVESVDIGFVPLASDPTRSIRLRRITVQPGGVIPWHSHEAMQGMALLVSGTMTEFRNTCLDPIVHHAGDVTREDAGTAHGWRNESDEVAVILVSHVVVR